MKHAVKLGLIMLCVVFLTTALANSKNNPVPMKSTVKNPVDQETPYRPGRQMEVLFVEDLNGGFGPATTPDPVWDGILTGIFGAGNYGWFGPTASTFENGPDYATMSPYDLVIWNTYDDWWGAPEGEDPALTLVDQTELSDYMLDGGNVWLISQDGIYTGIDWTWLQTYFHIASVVEDYVFGLPATNVAGTAEISGWAFYDTTDYVSNPFYPDDLTPDAEAHVVFQDTDYTTDPGIFYDGTLYKSAFWGLDGRTTDPYSEWYSMVTYMLAAFGVYGIEEGSSPDAARTVQLNIAPVPAVKSPVSISYTLPTAGHVELTIYDKVGRNIATLLDEHKPAGSYSVTWHANVASGVYFVRLTCRGQSSVKNLVLVN